MELTAIQIVGAFAAMSAVIAALWKYISVRDQAERARLDNYQTKEQLRLERCELLHAEQAAAVVDLTKRLSYLEGEHDGIKNLSRSVLETLERRRKD